MEYFESNVDVIRRQVKANRTYTEISNFAVIIGFPGDTPGKSPGTCGEWCIFEQKIVPRGRGIVLFMKRTRQTAGMHPRDLLDIGLQ